MAVIALTPQPMRQSTEGVERDMEDAQGRVFLFLQGPHGPFFRRLAGDLKRRGAVVRRIAFNAADEAEWCDAGPLDRFLGPGEAYASWLTRHLAAYRVTDIVLYGDARPEHAQAVSVASPWGIRIHCFEEGYLRPHWVTYERSGTNGNSAVMKIDLDRMALSQTGTETASATVRDSEGWGSARAHIWHSARYHLRLLFPSFRYGRYRSRRKLGLWREFALYARRLATLPWRNLIHGLQVRRLLAGDREYHLALLQLSFDASMQAHSRFCSMAEFVEETVAAFARGAPAEDLLVFKTHPFEDGRERLGNIAAREAHRHGIAGRVVFLDGGASLATLLDAALSVVTVNSTAGQQALSRGLPVAALGKAVYARPGLTSGQDLAQFFAAPDPPSGSQYRTFRRFLIETSQIRGSFYSEHGIRMLLARLPAALLAAQDPYSRALASDSRDPLAPAVPRKAAG
jgi:capsular polysaccharide export protein